MSCFMHPSIHLGHSNRVFSLKPQVLEAQNHEIVSPSDRSNLHPLVIPLAVQQPRKGLSEPMYTCLLRQVTLSNAGDQVRLYDVSSPRIVLH